MKGRIRAAAFSGIAFIALAGTIPRQVAAQSHAPAITHPMADAPYWNAALPVEQRVADLLARMTLEEKVAQIITVWNS